MDFLSNILSGSILSKNNIFFILEFLFSFIFWCFSPTTNIPLGIFILLILIISYFLFFIGKKNNKEKKDILSKIMTIKVNDEKFLFIAKASEIIKINTLIQFYYNEDNYEKPMGYGKVIHIQEDKLIQIETIQMDWDDSLHKKLKNNNSDVIKKIKFSPYINYKFLEKVLT